MTLQARVLLLAPLRVSLWCPQPAASGEEDAEGQLQFRSDCGVAGRVLRTKELVALDNPQGDPDFDVLVDGILGALSSVSLFDALAHRRCQSCCCCLSELVAMLVGFNCGPTRVSRAASV